MGADFGDGVDIIAAEEDAEIDELARLISRVCWIVEREKDEAVRVSYLLSVHRES